MTEADYRAMASEIRDLIPSLLHSESVADLRLLADRYETLAHCLAQWRGSEEMARTRISCAHLRE